MVFEDTMKRVQEQKSIPIKSINLEIKQYKLPNKKEETNEFINQLTGDPFKDAHNSKSKIRNLRLAKLNLANYYKDETQKLKMQENQQSDLVNTFRGDPFKSAFNRRNYDLQ